MTFKKLWHNPGNYFFQTELRRSFYRYVVNTYRRRYIAASQRLLQTLPQPQQSISEQGYLVLPPASGSSRHSVVAMGQQVVARHLSQGKVQHEHLMNILTWQDIIQHPDIVRYGLTEELVLPVAHYMGQIPVMPVIFLWHSVPCNKPLQGSQLWHLDHSDVRQIKVFVFLQDIDEDNGPLVLIPAPRSQKLRQQLRYNWHNRRRITDKEMYRLINPDKDVVKITGAKGTAAIVDTSRCFHHGSRLQRDSRNVLLYRYMSYATFIFNPFPSPPQYPLARFAKLPGLSPLQRTILTGVPDLR